MGEEGMDEGTGGPWGRVPVPCPNPSPGNLWGWRSWGLSCLLLPLMSLFSTFVVLAIVALVASLLGFGGIAGVSKSLARYALIGAVILFPVGFFLR